MVYSCKQHICTLSLTSYFDSTYSSILWSYTVLFLFREAHTSLILNFNDVRVKKSQVATQVVASTLYFTTQYSCMHDTSSTESQTQTDSAPRATTRTMHTIQSRTNLQRHGTVETTIAANQTNYQDSKAAKQGGQRLAAAKTHHPPDEEDDARCKSFPPKTALPSQ